MNSFINSTLNWDLVGLKWLNLCQVVLTMPSKTTGMRECQFDTKSLAESATDINHSSSPFFPSLSPCFSIRSLVRQKRLRGESITSLGSAFDLVGVAAADIGSSSVAKSMSSNSLSSPRFAPYMRSTTMSKSRSEQVIGAPPHMSPRKTQAYPVDPFSPSPFSSPIFSPIMSRSQSFSTPASYSPPTPLNYRLKPIPSTNIARDLNKEVFDGRTGQHQPTGERDRKFTPPATPDRPALPRKDSTSPTPSTAAAEYPFVAPSTPFQQPGVQQVFDSTSSWNEAQQQEDFNNALGFETLQPFAALHIGDQQFEPYEVPAHEQQYFDEKYGAGSQHHADQLYLTHSQAFDAQQLGISESSENLRLAALYAEENQGSPYIHPGHSLLPELHLDYQNEPLSMDPWASHSGLVEPTPPPPPTMYTSGGDYYAPFEAQSISSSTTRSDSSTSGLQPPSYAPSPSTSPYPQSPLSGSTAQHFPFASAGHSTPTQYDDSKAMQEQTQNGSPGLSRSTKSRNLLASTLSGPIQLSPLPSPSLNSIHHLSPNDSSQLGYLPTKGLSRSQSTRSPGGYNEVPNSTPRPSHTLDTFYSQQHQQAPPLAHMMTAFSSTTPQPSGTDVPRSLIPLPTRQDSSHSHLDRSYSPGSNRVAQSPSVRRGGAHHFGARTAMSNGGGNMHSNGPAGPIWNGGHPTSNLMDVDKHGRASFSSLTYG